MVKYDDMMRVHTFSVQARLLGSFEFVDFFYIFMLFTCRNWSNRRHGARWLTSTGMWTDNTRNAKIKGDQIEVFKILNGYENIDSNIFFRN